MVEKNVVWLSSLLTSAVRDNASSSSTRSGKYSAVGWPVNYHIESPLREERNIAKGPIMKGRTGGKV